MVAEIGFEPMTFRLCLTSCRCSIPQSCSMSVPPGRHLYDAHTHRADTLIIAQVFPARQWGIYGFLIRTKIEQNPNFSKLVKLGIDI